MMISEFSFGWLHEAEEERFARELEQRRVIAERIAGRPDEQADEHSGGHSGEHAGGARGSARPLRRALQRLSAAGGTM